MATKNTRFLILIGGCSRTGKSYLAQELERKFRLNNVNSIVLNLDNWLIGIDERTGKETVSERYNYPKIISSVQKIMKGDRIFPPFYNSKTRLVTKSNETISVQLDAGICIVNGVVTLDIPELRKLANLKIFTEVNDDIRKHRLMEFYYQYKGCSSEESKMIIGERELEEVPYIKKTKIFADIVYQPKY